MLRLMVFVEIPIVTGYPSPTMACDTLKIWVWNQQARVWPVVVALQSVVLPTDFMIQMPTAKPANVLTVLKYSAAQPARVEVRIHFGRNIVVVARHALVVTSIR